MNGESSSPLIHPISLPSTPTARLERARAQSQDTTERGATPPSLPSSAARSRAYALPGRVADSSPPVTYHSPRQIRICSLPVPAAHQKGCLLGLVTRVGRGRGSHDTRGF